MENIKITKALFDFELNGNSPDRHTRIMARGKAQAAGLLDANLELKPEYRRYLDQLTQLHQTGFDTAELMDVCHKSIGKVKPVDNGDGKVRALYERLRGSL